jgi:hypothetical protein
MTPQKASSKLTSPPLAIPRRGKSSNQEGIFAGMAVLLSGKIGVSCRRPDPLPVARLGYLLPAATWLIADLQASLRSVRADVMQAIFAARRRASAQCSFTSAVHAFAAAAVAANKF